MNLQVLYDHCVRSIDHALNSGSLDYPLLVRGEWNDGMDKVGAHGKGEVYGLHFFI